MFELIIAAVLIVLNGLFAVSELAVVSARKGRLKALVLRGRPGAAAALALAEAPGRFLSTVQIGITLVGILAGTFSGAALGERLGASIAAQGLAQRVAEPIGYGVVIGVITLLSVIIGELVPKHLALRNPESIACTMAPAMRSLAVAAGPLVWFLDSTTQAIMRILGSRAASAAAVTEEEIRTIVAEARTAGVIEPAEHRMIGGVLRLGDRSVRGLMTPRTDVDWLDLGDDEATMRARVEASPHSRLPVIDKDPDDVVGVVTVRDLLAGVLAGRPLDVRAHLHPAPVVPDTLDALGVLEALQHAAVPMALVHDEYGHFEGIVTPADALAAIVGAFRSDEPEEDSAIQREDGSWLLAGSLPADEMADIVGVGLPEERDYDTVAGLVIAAMQRLPATGDSVEALGWRFEVVDMDGRRVDKVLAIRL
ncbi:hemolysin family protein [Chelatococcus reniformis]|uniref:DNA-binding protein n=1 Tax=Chelatococcus reniformis TaxID=1494448 RepID=A0A916XF61_9HYPH|nr:hemolysin family protein [Chelatococcus reniformis]GGC67428.1 DNA-binding protein [Chelatococcus reniformis]